MNEPKFHPDYPNLRQPDFGSPEAFGKCKKSIFVGGYHRVILVKDRYDPNGSPGWILKAMCSECGKHFKNRGAFIYDPNPPKP